MTTLIDVLNELQTKGVDDNGNIRWLTSQSILSNWLREKTAEAAGSAESENELSALVDLVEHTLGSRGSSTAGSASIPAGFSSFYKKHSYFSAYPDYETKFYTWIDDMINRFGAQEVASLLSSADTILRR